MSNSEKVIKGLECHLKELSIGKTCYECPYIGDNPCEIQLIANALELLKEQDEIIESLTKEKERLLSERIAELQHNIDALHATMQDAILVNNAIKQRKAVKWLDEVG